MPWIKRLYYYTCWFAYLRVSSKLIKLLSPLISCVKEFHSFTRAVCISTAWFAVFLCLKELNLLLFTQWILLVLHMPRIKVSVRHPLAHERCWASQYNPLRPASRPARSFCRPADPRLVAWRCCVQLDKSLHMAFSANHTRQPVLSPRSTFQAVGSSGLLPKYRYFIKHQSHPVLRDRLSAVPKLLLWRSRVKCHSQC